MCWHLQVHIFVNKYIHSKTKSTKSYCHRRQCKVSIDLPTSAAPSLWGVNAVTRPCVTLHRLYKSSVRYRFVSPLPLQGSSMRRRRRTGRRRTPTTTRRSRATTPSTTPGPSRRSSTCCCARSCSTCKPRPPPPLPPDTRPFKRVHQRWTMWWKKDFTLRLFGIALWFTFIGEWCFHSSFASQFLFSLKRRDLDLTFVGVCTNMCSCIWSIWSISAALQHFISLLFYPYYLRLRYGYVLRCWLLG